MDKLHIYPGCPRPTPHSGQDENSCSPYSAWEPFPHWMAIKASQCNTNSSLSSFLVDVYFRIPPHSPVALHSQYSLRNYLLWSAWKEYWVQKQIIHLFLQSSQLHIFLLKRKWKLVAQSCLTLSDPVDCSPPGSSVHGILQARILEWVAISFSRGFSRPRDQTRVSCIAGRFFTNWATREAHNCELRVRGTVPLPRTPWYPHCINCTIFLFPFPHSFFLLIIIISCFSLMLYLFLSSLP